MDDIRIQLNDDGTLHIHGFDDPAVKEWCALHHQEITIGQRYVGPEFEILGYPEVVQGVRDG